jgi:hypothetical protein
MNNEKTNNLFGKWVKEIKIKCGNNMVLSM